ncbi:MAG: hypothetical protein KY476_14825 [Planctomycetes bacterium]|nr:hypothetical protein [Planctomycetota bacterium]
MSLTLIGILVAIDAAQFAIRWFVRALWSVLCAGPRAIRRAIRSARSRRLQRQLKIEREEQNRQACERQRVEGTHQKRREDARARVDLLYSLYAPEISDRFPREDFTAFCNTYLADSKAPEHVEERAAQLTRIIEQHREKVGESQRFKSLTELTAWFDEQKRDIEDCPDERMRRMLLAQLKERYTELSASILEQI